MRSPDAIPSRADHVLMLAQLARVSKGRINPAQAKKLLGTGPGKSYRAMETDLTAFLRTAPKASDE